MKIIWLLCPLMMVAGCNTGEPETIDVSVLPADVHASVYPGTLDTRAKRLAYSMGVNMAHRLKAEQVVIDVQAFALGMQHTLNDNEPLMTQKEVAQYLLAEERDRLVKREEFDAILAKKNAEKAETFFAENAKDPRVITLPNGLQYIPKRQGVGEPPLEADTVEVRYTAKFIDGTVFEDSSLHGGEVAFVVDAVIKGWSEALQRMPPGSHWRIFVPPELAYGEKGYEDAVPPNAVLIFDTELVSVSKKQT